MGFDLIPSERQLQQKIYTAWQKGEGLLTPGRYVGAADHEDDDEPFAQKMARLSRTYYAKVREAAKLDNPIRQNLETPGYGEKK